MFKIYKIILILILISFSLQAKSHVQHYDNLNQLQYKDRSGTCFGFDAQEVTCPMKKELVREYPIQEGRKLNK